MAKKTAIKCPYCGHEYLPGEIYIPKYFVGQPKNIIKDEKGAILGYDDNDMDTTETYICDNCNKKFSVDAVVTFRTEKVEDIFESDVYTAGK